MNEPDPSDRPSEPATQTDTVFRAPEALISGIILGFVGLGLILLLLRASDIEWTWEYWGSSDGVFDKSVIFRNFGLLVLALIALPLAIWRSVLAHQAHRLSEKGLIIDRYQKGAQMLESDNLSVRLAGVYALRELAKSDPSDTYIMVQDLLFDFVRERSKERAPRFDKVTKKRSSPEYDSFAADLKIALETASWLRDNVPEAMVHETMNDWRPNLREANLSHAQIHDINLSNAILHGAKLQFAVFKKTNLTAAIIAGVNVFGTRFDGVDLSKAKLRFLKFEKTILINANVTDTHFIGNKFEDYCTFGDLWFWAPHVPLQAPEQITKAAAFRYPNEDWRAFAARRARDKEIEIEEARLGLPTF
ncbi:pentapeptide repeat-containing protein [Roseibium album]|uniref:pentapeptide repeat-containing protein n=1 Tax=Roseibium album TaxID=311410 RepID=UPI00248FDFB3|nr:pentapeptide repeat-containing protein [Roseibium album]